VKLIAKQWILKSEYQGDTYWVEIWQHENEKRIVIGAFDGSVIKTEFTDHENLRLGISISPKEQKS
jgi:hypothetical protein